MANVNFLWVDMRLDVSSRSYYDDFITQYQGYKVEGTVSDSTVIGCEPAFACFDFDFPVEKDLIALRHFKARHPSVPIIMLTVQHSERLVLWALRSRVWDFIIKPFNLSDAMLRIEPLTQMQERQQEQRSNLFPEHGVPEPECFLSVSKLRSLPAVQFIKEKYGQKITVGMLAKICHQSTSSFSRMFKHEQGVSVNHFIIEYRLEKARALLEIGWSVSDAAYAVGFNDVSYFGRSFRRFIGLTPTAYLKLLPTVENSEKILDKSVLVND